MQPKNKGPGKTLLFGSFISFVMTVPTGRPYFYFPDRKAMHKPSSIYWTKELLLIHRTRMGEQVKQYSTVPTIWIKTSQQNISSLCCWPRHYFCLPALHLCSAAGHEVCVDILLRVHNVDRAIKDCCGKTAKELALKPSVRDIFDKDRTVA